MAAVCCVTPVPCSSGASFSYATPPETSVPADTPIYLPQLGVNPTVASPYVLYLRAPSIVSATLTLGYDTNNSQTASDVIASVRIAPLSGDDVTQDITQGGRIGGQFENGLQLVLPAGTYYIQGAVVSESAAMYNLSARFDIQVIALHAHTVLPATCCATPAVAQAATFVMNFSQGPGIGTNSTAYLPHVGDADTAVNIINPSPYVLRLTAPSLISAKLFADAIFIATDGDDGTFYDVIGARVTITRRSDGEEFSQTISTTAQSTNNSGQYAAVSTGDQVIVGAGIYEVQGALTFSVPSPTPSTSDIVLIDARLNVFALPLHSE